MLLSTLALTVVLALGIFSAPALAWSPPALNSPITVEVTEANAQLHLDSTRDYLIRLPAGRPLSVEGGLWLIGGHNVVVQGGEISVPWNDGGPDRKYGVFAKNQTGTLHLEGLLLHGPGLAVGIALDQGAGATVQVQNTRVEVTHPLTDAVHPDVMQTWRGPYILRIDRLTGITTSGGLKFQPHEYDVQRLGTWDLQNINLSGGQYILWKNDWSLQTGGHVGFWKERRQNFWVRPDRSWGWAYPDEAHWSAGR
jgi:hypothetical protein